MYGWRGRIGHICPSIPIDMIMNEFQLMLPDGVQMVYSSLHVQNIQNSDFDRALERLTEATEQIADGEVDCIIAGGGPLVAMRGTDADIVEHITSIAKVPSSTTTGAMISALRHLEAKRVAIASPYSDERNVLLGKYLESQGFEVVGQKGLGLTRAMDIAKLPWHASYELARKAAADAPGADAIYMPCARFPIIGNIDIIEQDTGIPIVTSVQSMTWWGLNAIGIGEEILGFGLLLEDR
ncbi:MAG: maleate isomerase [Chloroflexi bacterium]|jgi:maleate cis-trans isomerase|nr:MAG: maleate isomerase [Chloroflexota bacterium]